MEFNSHFSAPILRPARTASHPIRQYVKVSSFFSSQKRSFRILQKNNLPESSQKPETPRKCWSPVCFGLSLGPVHVPLLLLLLTLAFLAYTLGAFQRADFRIRPPTISLIQINNKANVFTRPQGALFNVVSFLLAMTKFLWVSKRETINF